MAACYLLLNLTEKKRNFWRQRRRLSHGDLLWPTIFAKI